MTSLKLTRRVDALEEAKLRDMAGRFAAEHGLPVDELLGDARRLAARERRLRAQGLSEAEVGRGLLVWIASDLKLDPADLDAEWERERRRLR